MIYWDKTKASTPHRNLALADHICDTPEARRYREQAIAGMKQAEAARIQKAHAAFMKGKAKK